LAAKAVPQQIINYAASLIRPAWSDTVEFSINGNHFSMDGSSGKVVLSKYQLQANGQPVPIFDGQTSQYFIYEAVSTSSALLMTVVNRKDLSVSFTSKGFVTYDVLPIGNFHESMFMTLLVANDLANPVYLDRVDF
jgi:hypothetical protein